jgi:hypothetical protein
MSDDKTQVQKLMAAAKRINARRDTASEIKARPPIQKAYADYLNARFLSTDSDPSEGEEYTPVALAGMQRAMLDALQSDGPLPDEMRLHLAFSFEHLCAGIASNLLTPVKRPGGRENPIAKHMQAAAIRYLRWVEGGLIQDNHPTSSVAKAYSVETRTVRNWQNAWRDLPTPGIHEEYGADVVTRFMKATGKQYRRFIPKPKPKGW